MANSHHAITLNLVCDDCDHEDTYDVDVWEGSYSFNCASCGYENDRDDYYEILADREEAYRDDVAEMLRFG